MEEDEDASHAMEDEHGEATPVRRPTPKSTSRVSTGSNNRRRTGQAESISCLICGCSCKDRTAAGEQGFGLGWLELA